MTAKIALPYPQDAANVIADAVTQRILQEDKQYRMPANWNVTPDDRDPPTADTYKFVSRHTGEVIYGVMDDLNAILHAQPTLPTEPPEFVPIPFTVTGFTAANPATANISESPNPIATGMFVQFGGAADADPAVNARINGVKGTVTGITPTSITVDGLDLTGLAVEMVAATGTTIKTLVDFPEATASKSGSKTSGIL
jgi:hypothetical protein